MTVVKVENFIILIWLFTLSGYGFETYYFVAHEQTFNFSNADTVCKNLTTGLIATAEETSTQQYIGNCSAELNVNGTFWIKTFEDEPSSWLCDYETEDNCFLTINSDNGYSWMRHTGPTESGPTGPESAYDGDYYIYLEASRIPDGAEFIMESSPLQVDTQLCLVFYYHMYGLAMGSLSVKLVSSDTSTLWAREGNKGDVWLLGAAEIPSGHSQSVIQIIGQRGDNYRSDIALDNIELKYGNCDLYANVEDKECGDVKNSTEGSITSPNYPSNYPNSADCAWVITLPKGYHIQIQIQSLELEENEFDDGCYDYIEITGSNGESILGRTCTLPTNNVIQTTLNELVIKFKSDDSRRRKGFDISWSSELVYCPGASISNGTFLPVMIVCSVLLNNVVCDVPKENASSCRQYPALESTPTSVEQTTESMTTLQTTENMMMNMSMTLSSTMKVPIEAIAGGIVGFLLIVILVAVAIAVFKLRNKKKAKSREQLFQRSHMNIAYESSTVTSNISNDLTSTTSPITNGSQSYTVLQNGIPSNVQNAEHIDIFGDKPAMASTNKPERIQEETYENTKLSSDIDVYDHLHGRKDSVSKEPSFEAPSYDHIPSNSHNVDRGSHIYDHTSRESVEFKNENESESVYMNT